MNGGPTLALWGQMRWIRLANCLTLRELTAAWLVIDWRLPSGRCCTQAPWSPVTMPAHDLTAMR